MSNLRLFKFLLLCCLLVKVECRPSVIIVGSGIAGIAAATRLFENNITSITILEAEHRIGGRINSENFGDAVIDLGAQWCHGEKDNIVYKLAQDLGVFGETNINILHAYSTRYEIDGDFNEELQSYYYLLEEQRVEPFALNNQSMGDFFILQHHENIKNKYANEPHKLKIVQEALYLYLHMGIGLDGAYSWFDPSALSDYKECEGNQVINWKGDGYKTLINILLKKHRHHRRHVPLESKIQMNKEVSKIVWDSNTLNPGGVTVTCNDGTVYYADHVIVTIPLGALKVNYASLFSPGLPKAKRNAIRDIGFGAVMKIFLHFPVIWWPKGNFAGVNFIWSDEDKTALLDENLHGHINRSWLLDINGFYPLTSNDNPNVLLIWANGLTVPDVEKMSDLTIIDGLMFLFNKFLGHKYQITRPDKIIRSNWASNSHFRGTYSFQTVKSRKRKTLSEMELSKPLTASKGKPSLLFAGEATHPHYFGTVHGALETGYREADRILNWHYISETHH